MIRLIRTYRYLIARRILQIALLFLFWSSNYFGWKILEGNFSTAMVLDSFYLADPLTALQILATGSLITLDIFIGTLIILIFYALFAGRAFCSWVCPVNIITDLSSFLRKRLGIKANNIGIKLKRNLRYLVLALALILSLISGIAAYESINPIGLLTRGIIFGFSWSIFYLIFILLLDLLVQEYAFCGHICPVGALYDMLGRKSMLKIDFNNDNCTKCMLCKNVCPEVQVLSIIAKESGSIRGACHKCGRCIEVCEDNALKYSFKF